jgi:hypothetical protein
MKKMNLKKTIGIMCFCWLASWPAFGQETPRQPQDGHAGQNNQAVKLDYGPVFDTLDADHDGSVTRSEWFAGGLSEHTFEHLFSIMLDVDKDGTVDKEEFTASSPQFEVDTDQDGNVSLAEYVTANNGRAALMSSRGDSTPPPTDHGGASVSTPVSR